MGGYYFHLIETLNGHQRTEIGKRGNSGVALAIGSFALMFGVLKMMLPF